MGKLLYLIKLFNDMPSPKILMASDAAAMMGGNVGNRKRGEGGGTVKVELISLVHCQVPQFGWQVMPQK
jgi:Ni,Fe-hydrogenase III small subunit